MEEQQMFQTQNEISLQEYLHVLRRWRWVIMAVFTVVVLGVLFLSLRQTPIYRATVRLLIEKESSNFAPFKDTYYYFNWDPDYLQTQYKIITSRGLAKQVLQKLGMFDQPVQPQPQPAKFSLYSLFSQLSEFLGIQKPPLSEQAKVTTKEDQIIGSFLGRIMVTPIRESRLVDVSVTSINPEEAARIANTLGETYIAQNLETKVAASRDAVRWLVDEVETARKKMADAEAALQAYKEQYAIISFEERQNIVMQRLLDLSTQVNQAKLKRMTLETQYTQVKNYRKNDLSTMPQVISNPVVQELKIKLLNLEGEYLDALQKFREKHPVVLALQTQMTGLKNQLAVEIQQIAAGMKNEYELALAQEQELVTALEQQKTEALTLNQKAITFGILQEEAQSNRLMYNTLLQKTKEMSVTERLETSNIRLVDRATIPNAPIAPRTQRNGALAMLMGLILGATLAFLLEYMDNSLKIPEDVTQYLDIPFLGFIPEMSGEFAPSNVIKQVEATIVATTPKSIVSEAYRSLRTSVLFSMLHESAEAHEPGSVVLITSSEPSEGKSCTTANLGIAMAQSGRKTLIIDCDFRKPVMHQVFGVSNENGFADVLTNAHISGSKRGLIKRTAIPNLDVIPCGKIPSNPSELLGSEITRVAIGALRERYETILIDSPPVNTVTDPVILSGLATGVIIVIRAGMTRRDLVQRTRNQLRSVSAKILGGVLNGVNIQKNKYYYYYAYHYPHYYRQDPEMAAGMSSKKLPGSSLHKLIGRG
jgi:succinoglycan biosynthesis transport protein ExoP